MTGTNFSSWYRQDEGTVYAEFKSIGGAATGAIIVDLGSGVGTSDAFWIRNSTSNNQDFVTVFSNGGNERSGSFDLTDGKVALGMSSTGHAGAYNGSLSTASGALRPNNINVLSIFKEYTRPGAENNGTIKKIAYYGKRLSNAELQGLTS
jgi:hypothetical protein